MVATERRERAQIEEELENIKQQKEALKAALKIVENENASLRSVTPYAPLPQTPNVYQPPSPPNQIEEESLKSGKRPSISSVKERPRALAIDTDRAGGNHRSEATQGSSKPAQEGNEENKTPTSTTSSKDKALDNLAHGADYSAMPTGGLSFV